MTVLGMVKTQIKRSESSMTEKLKEGDKVLAFVDYVNAWVNGTFMFYFNERYAFVRLDKVHIPVVTGVLYTNEPTVHVDKIKQIS